MEIYIRDAKFRDHLFSGNEIEFFFLTALFGKQPIMSIYEIKSGRSLKIFICLVCGQ